LERKAAIEKRFSDLDSQKEQIVTEMVRLQGEHRLICELIENKEDNAPERIRKVADSAEN